MSIKDRYDLSKKYFENITKQMPAYEEIDTEISLESIFHKNGIYMLEIDLNNYDILFDIYISKSPTSVYLFTTSQYLFSSFTHRHGCGIRLKSSTPSPLYKCTNESFAQIYYKSDNIIDLFCIPDLQKIIKAYLPDPMYKINLWEFPLFKKLLRDGIVLQVGFSEEPKENIKLMYHAVKHCPSRVINKELDYLFPFKFDRKKALIQYGGGSHSIIQL
jgi:hypothetical protein